MPTGALWITVVVVLLALGGTVSLSARAVTPLRQGGYFVAFAVLLASLPVWGSFVCLLAGSLLSNESGYWSAAPWLAIAIIFRYLQIAIMAGASAAAIYFLLRAEAPARLALATGTGVLILGIGAWHANENFPKSRQEVIAEEKDKAAAEAFVRAAPQTASLVPPPQWIGVSSIRRWDKGLSAQYAVSVLSQKDPRQHVRVFVRMDRSRSKPEFSWLCAVDDPEKSACPKQ